MARRRSERSGNLLVPVAKAGRLVVLPDAALASPRKAWAARQPFTGVNRHAGDARHPQARRAAPQEARGPGSGSGGPIHADGDDGGDDGDADDRAADK